MEEYIADYQSRGEETLYTAKKNGGGKFSILFLLIGHPLHTLAGKVNDSITKALNHPMRCN